MKLLLLPFFLLMPLAVWGYCEPPYVEVGETCLYFATMDQVTYAEARQLCQSATAALTHDVIDYMKSRGSPVYVCSLDAEGLTGNSFWLDGSDEVEEGHWVSSSGADIPMGTPFWAATLTHQEPCCGLNENCLQLFKSDAYYLNDYSCSHAINVICETPKQQFSSHSKNYTTQVLECPTFYVNIGGKCLAFMNWAEEAWDTAWQSCIGYHGELATIDDIEVLRALVLYIQQEGLADHSFWLGGSDAAEEGVWKWLDGTAVPMGTPFWGIGYHGQEPDGNTEENCLCLLASGYHYFRDIPCASTFTPICQYVQK